jgi:hypothetical protein
MKKGSLKVGEGEQSLWSARKCPRSSGPEVTKTNMLLACLTRLVRKGLQSTVLGPNEAGLVHLLSLIIVAFVASTVKLITGDSNLKVIP